MSSNNGLQKYSNSVPFSVSSSLTMLLMKFRLRILIFSFFTQVHFKSITVCIWRIYTFVHLTSRYGGSPWLGPFKATPGVTDHVLPFLSKIINVVCTMSCERDYWQPCCQFERLFASRTARRRSENHKRIEAWSVARGAAASPSPIVRPLFLYSSNQIVLIFSLINFNSVLY